MNLKSFEFLMDKIKSASERDTSLYKLGIDLQVVTETYHEIITHLLKSYYSSEGEDWISWYIYEKNGRDDIKAWNKDKVEICYDIKSLWECVEEIREREDFEVYEHIGHKTKSQEEMNDLFNNLFNNGDYGI